jgi:cytochrome bd ubiquinol oxidase subunit I
VTGWFTAEVGRQPWAIYGLLRTAQAVTPALSAGSVETSLVVCIATYGLIFVFGSVYVHRLLRVGPTGRLAAPNPNAMPRRPLSLANEHVASEDPNALAPMSPATSTIFER